MAGTGFKRKVAFIGAGNMAEAFCTGLLEKKLVSKSQVVASDLRAKKDLPWVSRVGLRLLGNVEAARFADVVVLSVKPKDMATALGEISAGLGPRELSSKLFVSIMAGRRVGSIAAALSQKPGQRLKVVRVMPNTPALVGSGMSAYCLGPGVGRGDADLVEALLAAVGKVVRVSRETEIDAVTAVSGSGPAYYFFFTDALEKASRRLGLSAETSALLARQTLQGAGDYANSLEKVPLEEMKRRVTSPGGTTEAALNVMEKPVTEWVLKGVEAARRRSVELGKKA
jgi:pyrroline-5-carboxylate reductase